MYKYWPMGINPFGYIITTMQIGLYFKILQDMVYNNASGVIRSKTLKEKPLQETLTKYTIPYYR